MKKRYIETKYKMSLATLLGICWVAFCIWFDQGWIAQLTEIYGAFAAWTITFGLALAPGFMAMFILFGLLSDKRPSFKHVEDFDDTSIIIAAYNEEDTIEATLDSIVRQEYPEKINVIIVDDGSTDDTTTNIFNWILNNDSDSDKFFFNLVELPDNVGKAAALNAGIKQVKTETCITLDADSSLYENAIHNIIANLIGSPENTAGVAGTVLARNSRLNWLTRLQEFDYFIGIAVIKRVQSLLGGTMVLPGAFSAYMTDVIVELGGWDENAVGEDIVLSYNLVSKNYRIGYAENAFLFTNVPTTYKQLFNQRKRWGRGLLEAFKSHPSIIKSKRLNSPFIINSLFGPFFDAMFLFVMVPGIILALTIQFYAIAGLMTLMFLPIGILLTILHFHKQHNIFKEYGLTIRKNWSGFLMYVLFFQLLVGTASIAGYIAEMANHKKTWGTK